MKVFLLNKQSVSALGLLLLCTIMFFVVSAFLSCLSLDPFLFKEEKASSYGLDSYTGERECADAIDSLIDLYGTFSTDSVRELSIPSGNETLFGMLLHDDSICDPVSDTLICFFYGTSNHSDYYWARTRLLHATGFPTLVIDYRGYGRSSGEPSEQGLLEDARSTIDYIRNFLGDPPVVVYAYSLGSIPGCEAAASDANNRVSRLILEAPIGSVETLVQDGSYLNLPGSFITSFTTNNTEKIKSITIPFLWLHGTGDETLNRETNGLPIWNNYNGERGCYIKVEGATHRTIPPTIGYNKYISCVRDFIRGQNNDIFTCE